MTAVRLCQIECAVAVVEKGNERGQGISRWAADV